MENRSAPESAIPRNEITKRFAIPTTAINTAIVTVENRMLPVTISMSVSSRNKKTKVNSSAILFSAKKLIWNFAAFRYSSEK